MGGHHPGGIAGLYQLIEDHGPALEFDLLTVGADLLDLWRGRLTWRRLAAIVASLPPASRTFQAINAELEGWTSETWLLHYAATQLRHLRYDFEVANTKKSRRSQVEKPEPIPFPGMPKQEPNRLAGDGTGRDIDEIKRLSAKYDA